MGIYSIKPRFQKFLMPVAHWLIKKKVHPTQINIAAVLVSLLGGLALYFSAWNVGLLFFIPFMAFGRIALNALDGMVARVLKVKHQAYGEVLNEFLDRVSDAAIFFGLALNPRVSLVLGSFTVIVILLNSYLSIVSKAAGGKRQYGGFMGKADRMIYLGIAAVLVLIAGDFDVFDYLFLFLLFGTLITIGQRFESMKRELKR